jgi:pseudouridine-5'-phosphate glycosidase
VSNSAHPPVLISDEVTSALAEGRGVVALETTIVVHGLPAPVNLEVAAACEEAVRESGSVPATIGVLEGHVVVGLSGEELERLASPVNDATKLSARDVGLAVGLGVDGATTVAATVALAHLVGITVMATGGVGGVHRDAQASFDESSDLTTLSRTPVLVVASGVKSILDVAATLERLDTLGVPVVGYRTTRFPGFYRSDSGYSIDWSVANVQEAAAAFEAHRRFSSTGFLLANPVASSDQLDAQLHDQALASAFEVARRLGVTGKEVTPVLLAEFARFSAGLSVQVNRALVVANARLAGEVAGAISLMTP